MSLARIAARQGPGEVATALTGDHRLYTEYVVALDLAWRRRDRPSVTQQIWLQSRNHLPFQIAEELYGHAIARGLHDAGQAIASGIASRYPEVS